MEVVPKNDYAKKEAYYLPHHSNLVEPSTATKLRVVLDASAKSTSGYSLNDLLMKDNSKEAVKEYRLTTVTYGTSCAPYLFTRTLTQLALEREKYPLASYATLHHFYVDDLLSGATTEKEAVELVWQLKEMMRKGGFNLQKWQSNSDQGGSRKSRF
ncbi:DUF1758 domain-containing protein [Trichonephila inaurata madagascariensis]|uniref:DUF1758 domain-containing protein n=1 Tax=Trichonephila inaurata madagascariensis TaxID=2747483 RepID=A0A8X6YJG9_9ARAC|nr:DUF1758 domain-containing protein [Trichonephila inaurata madagascariensis]GFY70709.1 DUF1758 domain-containing protein [Trichonephila inaurata madagascariensis]